MVDHPVERFLPYYIPELLADDVAFHVFLNCECWLVVQIIKDLQVFQPDPTHAQEFLNLDYLGQFQVSHLTVPYSSEATPDKCLYLNSCLGVSIVDMTILDLVDKIILVLNLDYRTCISWTPEAHPRMCLRYVWIGGRIAWETNSRPLSQFFLPPVFFLVFFQFELVGFKIYYLPLGRA